jgi:WD40 repeat protein
MKRFLAPLAFLLAATLVQAQPGGGGREIAVSQGQINNVLISPDGNYVAAQAARFKLNADDKKVGDGTEIVVWDATRGTVRFKTGRTKDRPVAFTPDSKQLVSVGTTEDGYAEVKTWEVFNGKPSPKLQTNQPSSVVFFPDGNTVMTIGKLKPSVEVLNFTSGVIVDSFTIEDHKYRNFRPSAQSPFLAIVETGPRTIGLYSRDTKSGKSKTTRLAGITSAIITPDGKQVIGNGEGKLRSFDAAGKLRWNSTGEYQRFHVDGKAIVGIEGRGRVTLLDAATGRKIRSIETGLRGTMSAALSKDGKTLIASGSKDNTRWAVLAFTVPGK